MTYKMICAVKNNQVVLTLPDDLRDKKEVTIFLLQKHRTYQNREVVYLL